MKKRFARLLTVMALTLTVIAVPVACTAGGDGTDTAPVNDTEESRAVTAPATEESTIEEPTAQVTDPAESDPTEVTTVQPGEIVNPETTAEETRPETNPLADIDGFDFDFEQVANHFSGEHLMSSERVELEDEGYVVKLSSTAAGNDPFIFFNFRTYRTAKKLPKYQAEDYAYVILRVKAEGCSTAKFELFYCAGSVTQPTGACVLQSSFHNDGDDWQYIVFNMKNANDWNGVIQGFRFDYQLSAAGAGENMYLSHVYFAKNDEEMKRITRYGLEDPFIYETDPEVEQKVEELLATKDPAPAPDNTKQDAAAEDANLELWFNHAYINNPAEDITSTNRNTYLLRMAKNESEGVHMFLASKEGHSGLTVSVTNFRNQSGAELKTELMYGYYFDDVEGKTLVDPIPWVKDGQTFDLAGGRSYMYVIKATSAMDSPAGEYEATVTVKDADGNEIKKAVVRAYVWNFVLPEETSCKTQVDLSWYNIYVAHECWEGDDSLLYKNYYDLLPGEPRLRLYPAL